MNAIEQLLRRPPTTVEDAQADLLLLDAELDHALLTGTLEQLDTTWDTFTAAWKRLEALQSQVPERHSGAWAC